MNSAITKNTEIRPEGSFIMLSTQSIVSEKNWRTKEDKDTCIVHTMASEKAHLGTKQHQTVDGKL